MRNTCILKNLRYHVDNSKIEHPTIRLFFQGLNKKFNNINKISIASSLTLLFNNFFYCIVIKTKIDVYAI